MTPRFLSPLVVRDEGGTFVLAEPLAYESAVLGGVLIVPAGFPTDFASIPRGLWSVLPPVGKYDAGAVCHDKLYRDGAFGGRAIARDVADRVLHEAMVVSGVHRVQRSLIYAGLRIGGWVVWRRYRFTKDTRDTKDTKAELPNKGHKGVNTVGYMSRSDFRIWLLTAWFPPALYKAIQFSTASLLSL